MDGSGLLGVILLVSLSSFLWDLYVASSFLYESNEISCPPDFGLCVRGYVLLHGLANAVFL